MRTTVRLQAEHKGEGPLLEDGGGGQEGGEESESSRQTSCCPSCSREYDVALLLPCSHTLCARCVAAGQGGARSGPYVCPGGAAILPACAVMCPRCHRLVELPCWGWASATHCLPRNAALSPAWSVADTALAHLEANTHCRDVEMCHLHVSSEASSSTAPADGAIDLQEEEMEKSVLGLSFGLDASSIPPSLRLSSSSLTVTYQGESGGSLEDLLPDRSSLRGPTVTADTEVTLSLPVVCANVVITQGQYYWEVDVCNSATYMIGVTSLDGCSGWWLERRGLAFWSVYDGAREPLHTVPPWIKTLGIFLNMGGGGLSFHNPLTQEHLATQPTRFSPSGVLPALGLGQGRLRLHSGLPPPTHVFLSKASGYRRPCRVGRWQRDVPFQSVRAIIQRFEQLAVSDSFSGLVSSSSSSCSTPNSLPGIHSSGPGCLCEPRQEEQEDE